MPASESRKDREPGPGGGDKGLFMGVALSGGVDYLLIHKPHRVCKEIMYLLGLQATEQNEKRPLGPRTSTGRQQAEKTTQLQTGAAFSGNWSAGDQSLGAGRTGATLLPGSSCLLSGEGS